MKQTIRTLHQKKLKGQKIAVLTAWDYLLAQVLDQSGVDVILVGDSLAMVALGYSTTLPLEVEEMIYHAKAVSRAVKSAFLVCDLPFLSYQGCSQEALKVAGRFLKETQAQAVKLEGGYPDMIQTIHFLVQRGIPVMGHVGLTPQSVHQLGYRQQGTDAENAQRIFDEALALQDAGAFSIVLEHIPEALARSISEAIAIPTIGIGAGPHCDGQVLVTADFLGLTEKQPPFAKPYGNLRQVIAEATRAYCHDVRAQTFPENPTTTN